MHSKENQNVTNMKKWKKEISMLREVKCRKVRKVC